MASSCVSVRLCTRLQNGATGTGGKKCKADRSWCKVGCHCCKYYRGSAETTGNPFDLRLNDKNATNFFCGK